MLERADRTQEQGQRLRPRGLHAWRSAHSHPLAIADALPRRAITDAPQRSSSLVLAMVAEASPTLVVKVVVIVGSRGRGSRGEACCTGGGVGWCAATDPSLGELEVATEST